MTSREAAKRFLPSLQAAAQELMLKAKWIEA
jgi:hypothetical protein